MTKQLLVTCSICCLILSSAKAQGEHKLSIFLENSSLKEIVKEIERQTDYSFIYNETIDLDSKKNISLDEKSLEHVLTTVFNGTGIQWNISGKHILLKKAKRKIKLSGYVTDQKTGETLIGASLSGLKSGSGNITNDYGYYSISLNENETQLQISYIGYKAKTIALDLKNDTTINMALEQYAWLEEVVIDSKTHKPFSPSAGSIEFSMEDIKNTPAAFGEADIIKTLQLLPGVQAGVEGAAGLYVRGGGPDQNLTLLDGVNVYNTSHFFGLFSIFNGDAVKKVTLYKGSFPARFGGRLSSVVDIRLKDGDMQNYHGNFSIGLLSSHLNLEGPIIKNKTSFNISARRSYVDAFLRVADMITEETVPIIYFYDLNAKINHKFSDKSRLYFSLYNGKDKMGSKTEYDVSYYSNSRSLSEVNYQWGNTVGSLRWNYIFNNKLFANTTVAYNNYNFDFKSTSGSLQNNEDGTSENHKYTNYQYSGIEDWSANTDFEYIPNNKHHIRFGAGYIYHTFKPEVHGTKLFEQLNGEVIKNTDHAFLNENIIGHETSLYAEDEIPLTDKWKTNAGLHFSTFSVDGKDYFSLQPRFSLGYEHNRNLSFKTSYTEMSQYIHLLTSSALSQPTDLWVPVTPELAPMRSRQVTLGAFYDTRNGYNFSVEGFYKQMNNLLEYKEGATWGTASTPWYKQVEAGEGRTYGIELFAQKTTGKLTGWIGYTLSWNDRKFPTINEGKRFSAKYDRRHDVKLNLTYKLNEKFDFSAAWTYASGNMVTIPFEEFSTVPFDLKDTPNNYYPGDYWLEKYEDRNNYRMPAMHHLDLSINYYRKKSAKGRQGIWNLTVYNVYNQSCPYLVYPGFSENKGKFVLKQISLLPILPSITYTYKF